MRLDFLTGAISNLRISFPSGIFILFHLYSYGKSESISFHKSLVYARHKQNLQMKSGISTHFH